MTVVWVSVVAFLAAAAAVVWPYLRVPAREKGLGPADRATWVTRLFALASLADESGDGQVSAAARALIAALVREKEVLRKGK